MPVGFLRWVRYEAPVMVCVAVDEDGEHRVVNVVAAEEHQDLYLVRDDEGAPLVYDERMERLPGDDVTLLAAVSEAEDREWPQPHEWESGPDAVCYPGLYDPVDVVDEDQDDDLEPLDLQGQPSR